MPITPFIGVRISWLMLARNADFMFDASTASSRATAVGVVELEQALETLAALAREQRDEPEQGQRRERGDRGAVDLLGDEQRDARERRVDDVDPALAELLGERSRRARSRSAARDDEVDDELRGERATSRSAERGRPGRRCASANTATGPIDEPRVADRLRRAGSAARRP